MAMCWRFSDIFSLLLIWDRETINTTTSRDSRICGSLLRYIFEQMLVDETLRSSMYLETEAGYKESEWS